MRKILSSLIVAAALAFASAPAQAAEGWTTFRSDKFGFQMDIPDEMDLKAAQVPGSKWGGLHGTIPGAELWGIARLGKKHRAPAIQAFGVAVTKIPAKYWWVFDRQQDKNGWDWYNLALATDGKHVLYAMYGTGPKGSYLLLLKVSVQFSKEHKEALIAFKDSIRLD